MFFFVITRNFNWEILTKNLVTFKMFTFQLLILSIPPLQNKCYANPTKTLFLAVVIALVSFYFNFILFVLTGHANFEFNPMINVYRMLFLALKKSLNGQIHYSSGSHHLIKKSSLAKFFIPLPLNTIWKTLTKGLQVGNPASYMGKYVLPDSIIFQRPSSPTLYEAVEMGLRWGITRCQY